MSKNKPKRLLCKVLSWRAISIISMLITMWALTGDFGRSTSITVIVQIIQTVVHATFEMIWSKKVDS
jgi:uncharacterized membrane protein